MTLTPDALRQHLESGLLAFPATPFDAAGALDAAAYEAHVAHLVSHRPAAIVPAGGAGEGFSLSIDEHARVVREAVRQSDGAVPVVAGVGHGAALAREMAQGAERAGADGILLLPPYLVAGEQAGLAAHIAAVCAAVSIGVVVYSRDNCILDTDTVLRLADRCPNLIGVKDGVGNFESLTDLALRAGDRLALVNGVPTAEIIAPQCRMLGIRAYSSAVFTFEPAIALAYLAALEADDRPGIDRLLRGFYLPLTALRRRRRGYAVSLIKAGMRAAGRPAGPVRPPLVDCTAEEEAELRALIEAQRPG